MKKKFLAIIVPAMMMASLAGCAGGGQYNDFCAKAADAAPLLLNSATGKEIFASETTVRELSNYNSVLALNTYTFQEKELSLTWDLQPAEKWVNSAYALDATRNKIAPVYGAEEFEASIKCTISYVEKGKTQGKAELGWKFKVAPTHVMEMTLKQLNEKFVENGNKLTGMDKDAEGKDISVGVRGYITETYEQPDHTYAGVFISDGEYSLQLYAGQISSLWKENNLKVGDCIFAVGPLSMYGIIEMKPTMMEPIDGKAYNIADPVTVDLTGKEMQGAANWLNQSSLVSISGCKYKSGLDSFKATSHSTLKFSCGEQEVKLYCSYHLGETMMNAIKDACSVEGFAEKTVTLKGILTVSSTDNDFEIIPVFGTGSIVVAA